MSWGPSDEAEWREAQEERRSLRRAERAWRSCGVWEDPAALARERSEHLSPPSSERDKSRDEQALPTAGVAEGGRR